MNRLGIVTGTLLRVYYTLHSRGHLIRQQVKQRH